MRTLLKLIIAVNAFFLGWAVVGFLYNLLTDVTGFSVDILLK